MNTTGLEKCPNNYGYDAFGQTTSQTGTADNKYQYAGEQFDSTLGDYYLRQRFYDTSSGRFGRMDKYEGDAFSPLTLNRYIYANANPIMGTDPSGFLTMFEQQVTISGQATLSSGAYVSVAKLSSTLQTARATVWFFTLLAASVTAHILTNDEMEEWELDIQPNKNPKNKNKYDYKLFPIDKEQRNEIDKNRGRANQMRVQIQTELERGADTGVALFASSKIGVTKAQVAAGLTSLWDLRGSIPFMSKTYINAFRDSIGLAWKDTERSGPVSIPWHQVSNREWDKNGNIVKKPAKGPNRVDVENIRGLNLRR